VNINFLLVELKINFVFLGGRARRVFARFLLQKIWKKMSSKLLSEKLKMSKASVLELISDIIEVEKRYNSLKKLAEERPGLSSKEMSTVMSEIERKLQNGKRLEREYKSIVALLEVNGFVDIADADPVLRLYFTDLFPCCRVLAEKSCGRCKWRAFEDEKALHDHISFVLSERPVRSTGERASN
jgi:hypothetical protein